MKSNTATLRPATFLILSARLELTKNALQSIALSWKCPSANTIEHLLNVSRIFGLADRRASRNGIIGFNCCF
jgi:hypothetical protein